MFTILENLLSEKAKHFTFNLWCILKQSVFLAMMRDWIPSQNGTVGDLCDVTWPDMTWSNTEMLYLHTASNSVCLNYSQFRVPLLEVMSAVAIGLRTARTVVFAAFLLAVIIRSFLDPSTVFYVWYVWPYHLAKHLTAGEYLVQFAKGSEQYSGMWTGWYCRYVVNFSIAFDLF